MVVFESFSFFQISFGRRCNVVDRIVGVAPSLDIGRGFIDKGHPLGEPVEARVGHGDVLNRINGAQVVVVAERKPPCSACRKVLLYRQSVLLFECPVDGRQMVL